MGKERTILEKPPANMNPVSENTRDEIQKRDRVGESMLSALEP